jgi:C-terminal processing protease CtpA/Prc
MKILLVAFAVALFTFQTARADAPGPVVGIGTELKSVGGHPVVTGVLADSPADKSGIRPNDRLLKIDGKSVDGLTLVQVSHLLRGIRGSHVEVTVDRHGETRDFGIRREILFVAHP